MNILLLIVLVFAHVLLVLILVNVPVSQKMINVFFLILVILMCVGSGVLRILS